MTARYFAITKDMHAVELVPVTDVLMDEMVIKAKVPVTGIPLYIDDRTRLWPLPSEKVTITRTIDSTDPEPHKPKEVQSCPILHYPHVCIGGTPIIHNTALEAYRLGRSDEANGF